MADLLEALLLQLQVKNEQLYLVNYLGLNIGPFLTEAKVREWAALNVIADRDYRTIVLQGPMYDGKVCRNAV